MRLIAKFAWIALPALAGCGMLSQVSSQGTGTNPGGKATGAYPPSWVQNLRFPEERDFLADAGLSQYKKYADYIKPNVGVPESKLGMTMLQFRVIEKEIAKRVLSRSPKEVVDQIKVEKYKLEPLEGANLAPENVDARNYMNWSRSRSLEEKNRVKREVANLRALDGSINVHIANFILSITDEVLKNNRIDPKSDPLLRSMAFVRGAYYFTAEGVQYEPIERSLGPGSIKSSGVPAKGAFILDRPRGVCHEQTIALIYIISSKSTELDIAASYYVNETATSPGDKPSFYGFNHGAVKVSYTRELFEEGFDATKRTVIDTRDTDALALWSTAYSGALLSPPYTGLQTDNIRINDGDPFSTLSRQTFQSLGPTVNNSIRDAMRR